MGVLKDKVITPFHTKTIKDNRKPKMCIFRAKINK